MKSTGAAIPSEAMMHFPLFRICLPYFGKIFSIFPIFLFPKTFFEFFSHRLQILNFSPIFFVSLHFLLFRENYYFPPTFTNLPLFSKNLRVFIYCRPTCISFLPYFDHDAFMHHTMHVLDASGSRLRA